MEVIIAIFILTVAVAGSFILIQQSLANASLNKSKLIAFYLAQEGIEIVRNIRDNNWLAFGETQWKQGLATGDYEAAYNDLALSTFSDRNLYIDSVSGFYSYSGDTETPFKRKISIAELDNPAENTTFLIVKAVIEWREKGIPHNVEVVENLYNWY